MGPNPVANFLKFQCPYGSYFYKLKVVKIRGIWGTTPELEFISFILAHSPVLEMMTIVKYRGERLSESMLQRVERSSEHVKIISLTL